VIDLAGQMADMVVASRHYQVTLRVVSAAQEAYEAVLSIGRGR
jgi:flagellar basal body rod protein FlgC